MKTNKKTLTVVCPAYNEEEVIERFCGELTRVLLSVRNRYQADILVVVDRSRDRTIEILRRLSDSASEVPVRVLALSSRFGHQAALLAGMDHCDADAVIMMDSDLQHPPSLIPQLIEKFEAGNEIVYTVRRSGQETRFLKRLTSRLFYKIISQICKVPISESAADFRLVSRRVVELFQNEIRERNQFLRGIFAWMGFKSASVEFQVAPRGGGRSKYDTLRLFRFASDGIVSFSKRPLQAALVVGLFFAASALGLAGLTMIQWAFLKQLPSGWTTIVVLVSGMGGIQLLFLGVVGSYIGAIFDEVKGRPHYIVEERIGFEQAETTRLAPPRRGVAKR